MSKEKKTCGNCGMAIDAGSKKNGWVICSKLDNPVKTDQSPNCWEEPKYR